MTEFDWLRAIYLLMALGLILGTWRVHRGGGKRILVLLLAWVCIFMVAVGIAGYVEGWLQPAPMMPPSPNTDPSFT